MTTQPEKWIFQLKLRNREGVLSSLTALFSDRGLSLESLSAHEGTGPGMTGTAILTFAATAARKDHLTRLMGRLDTVELVAVLRYDDAAHARKSALARVSLPADNLKAALPPVILCDIVSSTETETLVLLLGPPKMLDEVLAALTAQGALQEVDATIIVV